MDFQIGRVLEALKESGEYENTYIFFTSDHGIAIGKHGLMGKQNLYEHSWKIPFVVSGPEIKKKTQKQKEIFICLMFCQLFVRLLASQFQKLLMA